MKRGRRPRDADGVLSGGNVVFDSLRRARLGALGARVSLLRPDRSRVLLFTQRSGPTFFCGRLSRCSLLRTAREICLPCAQQAAACARHLAVPATRAAPSNLCLGSMAAATETRYVSFAPATPVKDEPGFPILERRLRRSASTSRPSNVLIAAPRPQTERPELGGAGLHDGEKKLGASPTPPRTGACTVDVHMSPGRDLTAGRTSTKLGTRARCPPATGCAGWPTRRPSRADAPSVGLPSAPSWARDSSWWKLDVAADEVADAQ